MSQILERLNLDHQRIEQMLAHLETLTIDGDEDRVFCILSYLADYPEKIHHPIEDVIFEVLSHETDDPELSDLIVQNRRQHGELESLTENLLLTLNTGQGYDEALPAYVQQQRAHMNFEEGTLFPAARRSLTEDAWQQVEHQLEHLRDPLYDQRENKYAALFSLLEEPTVGQAQASSAVARFLSATGD